MNENLEYQFLNTQLQSNNYIKAVIENDIAQLTQLILQKRQSLREIEDNSRQIGHRIHALSSKNKELVLVNYLPEVPIGNYQDEN